MDRDLFLIFRGRGWRSAEFHQKILREGVYTFFAVRGQRVRWGDANQRLKNEHLRNIHPEYVIKKNSKPLIDTGKPIGQHRVLPTPPEDCQCPPPHR